MKNPTWQRDELILALDLYFQLEPGQIRGLHRVPSSNTFIGVFDYQNYCTGRSGPGLLQLPSDAASGHQSFECGSFEKDY